MKFISTCCIVLFLLVQGCSTKSNPQYNDPETALRAYLLACKNKYVSTVMKLYGGDYSMFAYWSKEKDHRKAMVSYLEGSPCPIIDQIKELKKINEDEFQAIITLKNEDGTPFVTRRPDVTWDEFTYTLNKKDGIFKIEELPRPYQA